jgi:hypothetical protein
MFGAGASGKGAAIQRTLEREEGAIHIDGVKGKAGAIVAHRGVHNRIRRIIHGPYNGCHPPKGCPILAVAYGIGEGFRAKEIGGRVVQQGIPLYCDHTRLIGSSYL